MDDIESGPILESRLRGRRLIRAFAWTAGILAGLGAVLLYVTSQSNKGGKTMFPAHDSPIVITGGSIDGTVRWFHVFDEDKANVKYHMKPNSNVVIHSTLFGNGNPDVLVAQGWRVDIATPDGNGAPRMGAIQLCSSSNCDGITMDPKGWVYLVATTEDIGWIRSPLGGKLDYANASGGCSKTTPHGSSICAELDGMSITSNGVRGPYTACSDTQHKCTITVGNIVTRHTPW